MNTPATTMLVRLEWTGDRWMLVVDNPTGDKDGGRVYVTVTFEQSWQLPAALEAAAKIYREHRGNPGVPTYEEIVVPFEDIKFFHGK